MSFQRVRASELAFSTPEEGNTTVVAFTGTVASTTVTAQSVVRLVATEACFIDFSTTASATSSGVYLPGDTIEYFTVGSTNTTLSVIQSSAGGNLHVTEMTPVDFIDQIA